MIKNAYKRALSLLTINGQPIASAWENVNFVHKMVVTSGTVFSLLIVFFAILLDDEANRLSVIREREHIITFYLNLGQAYQAIEREEQLTIQSIKSVNYFVQSDESSASTIMANSESFIYYPLPMGNETLYNTVDPPILIETVMAAQKSTDRALNNAYTTATSPEYAQLLFPSSALACMRQKVNYRTLASSQLQVVRQCYAEILRDIANTMMRISQENQAKGPGFGRLLQAALLAVSSSEAVGMSKAATELMKIVSTAPRSAPYIFRPNGLPPDPNFVPNVTLNALVQDHSQTFLQSLYRVQGINKNILSSGERGPYASYLLARTALNKAPWLLADALGGSRPWVSPAVNLSTVAGNPVARTFVNQAQALAPLDVDSAFEGVYIAMLVVCSVAVLYFLFRWALHHHDRYNSEVSMRNAGVMHEISVRVGEFVEAFASFSLVVPPPPRTAQGTAVGIVETQLQLCLASLRSLAPSMPPLLFPARLARLAAIASEVKDSRSTSESIAAAVAPRETLKRDKITLIDYRDTTPEGNVYYQPMKDATALSARLTNAVILTVDTFFFSDCCAVQKRLNHTSNHVKQAQQLQREQWAHYAYRRFVSCVEECIYQYGGVMHFAGLDRIIGVWLVEGSDGGLGAMPALENDEAGGNSSGIKGSAPRISSPTARAANYTRTTAPDRNSNLLPFLAASPNQPSKCDAPTMCALALAGRLSQLKRAAAGGINDPYRLWSSVPAHIGVTAGPVVLGTFGTDQFKTIQLFGDPMRDGLAVARANQHTLASVTCDEVVRRAIDGQRHCKPVETLAGIGRVYEVIPPHIAAREVDLEAKLAAYRAAFALYEGKFFREALRAFRAYTKLYGYDRSVERLQAVITGL